MGSQVKVQKNRNLPLRHLPCLPRQFGFWKKLVESEILFGETELRDYRGGWVSLFVRRGIPTTKPHFCPVCFELQLLTFCGFNQESRVTRRTDFLEFSRIFDVSSLYIPFLKYFSDFCSLFWLVVRCSLYFVNRKSPLKNKIKIYTVYLY